MSNGTARIRSAALLGLVLASLAVATAAREQMPIVFAGEDQYREAGAHLMVLEDQERALDIETIRRQPERFEPVAEDGANFGLSTSAWWVRLVIVNDAPVPRSLVLRQDYPLIDELDVWAFGSDRLLAAWQTGDRRPFASRPIEHRDFLFPLNLAPGEQQTVFLRFASEGPVNMGLSVHSSEALMNRIAIEHLALGAYFGSFVLLAIAVLLLYLFDRERALLYYLLYIISYSCYMAQFNGLAYQFIWPNSPLLSAMGQVVLLSAALFFLLQFSRTMLDMDRVYPLLDRLAQFIQAGVVVCAIAAPFLDYGTLIRPLVPATLLTMVLVLAMGIAAHFRGLYAARYYLLAWSVFLFGVLAYIFKTVGWLPHNFLTQYGFQIGSFFEFVLLSFALGIRVQELKHQSQTDPLTGLANRGIFDGALREEFRNCSVPDGELSVLVLDVDRFKAFNDEYGHAAGDRILREVGRVLASEIRRPSRACRYGGEEFAVILPRVGRDDALRLAERLRATIEDRLKDDGVTISVGVSSRREHGFSESLELFEAADQALYRAKSSGRNRVEPSWETA